jgi:hypothetical protein
MSAGSSGLLDDEAQDALIHGIERLTGRAAFTVAEFAADGATIFEVERDQHGTPAPLWWKYRCENGALVVDDPGASRWSAAMTSPDRFFRQVAPRFIVCAPGPLPVELRNLMHGHPEVPIYTCAKRLRQLLMAALKESPLVLGYELAVLQRVPASRSAPEQLILTGHPLFSPGDSRGAGYKVRVDVEPTDDEGTVFAVVTREDRPQLPRRSWPLKPMQVQAARVRPGRYELTAVLTRPGQVRFEGLPPESWLDDSGRSWEELERLVPGQLVASQAPVHLICLAEVCGADDVLEQRVDRLEDLINEAQAGGLPLRVSVVAYGAHGVAWSVDDRPPDIRAWGVPSEEAIRVLRRPVDRQPDDREYPRAAQLECALKVTRERLLGVGGRPVIVTAGGRPAHPSALDTSRQIIPCPDWVDWATELRLLLREPGITFGALRDPGCRAEMWGPLGRHADATINDAVDMEGFTARLGLRRALQTVPFPVID